MGGDSNVECTENVGESKQQSKTEENGGESHPGGVGDSTVDSDNGRGDGGNLVG